MTFNQPHHIKPELLWRYALALAELLDKIALGRKTRVLGNLAHIKVGCDKQFLRLAYSYVVYVVRKAHVHLALERAAKIAVA